MPARPETLVPAVIDERAIPVPEQELDAGRRGLRKAVAALRHRDFALFWTGALLSNIGTWMQNVAVPYVLYRQTHSASIVGVAAFAQFIPGVLLGPWAGSIADRFDRRKVLLLNQAGSAAVAFLLWGLYATGHAGPMVIIALVFLTGAVFGVGVAAWQAFVTELVPKDELLNAITLNSAQFNGARAIGPALGGLVLARFGASWAFLANGISFATVLVALALVRRPVVRRPRAEGHVLAQFVEGLRYIRRHRSLLTAVLLISAVAFFGMPIFQLTPVLADKVFHVNAGHYGVLAGSLGAGAVVGAVFLGAMGDAYARSSIVRFAIGLFGLSLVALGLAPSFWWGVAAMAASGVAFLSAVASLQTSVQVLVSEHIRGRVLAVYVMCFTGAYPLGALLEGWAADHIGAQATSSIAGACLLVIAALLVVQPRLAGALDGHVHRAGTADGSTLA